jgi:isopenicillin-N N-acyltransferase-like protein
MIPIVYESHRLEGLRFFEKGSSGQEAYRHSIKMARKAAIPVIRVSGAYRDMGRALGSKCGRLARSMMQDAKAGFARKGIAWEAAVAQASDYAQYAQEYDPAYIELIEGYAKGSGLPFEGLFTLLCQGERGMCTDVAVNGSATSEGSVLSGHTEDWMSDDEKRVVLVHFKPKGGPSFVVATCAGLELITGLNSAGVSFSGNSLEQDDMRMGIPKMFLARRIMAARTIGEAISAAAPPNRGSSYNKNICHSSGEMYCVEGSATDFALLYPQNGYLVHTNHYLDQNMIRHETMFTGSGGQSLENGSSSIVRYNRARTLVRRSLGRITV